MPERIVENLNRALGQAMRNDERVVLIGEDIADPYGGAFKVTRGLTEKFPDRVISTPISELGFTGFANGLALAGQKPIVEYMFGDFMFLAADQIINFAAKTVDMYGRSQRHCILFRCPVGGRRGYGATHSQSVQKHFMGVPGLDLFEASPLHDATAYLPRILDSGRPSILFEQKTLYARPLRVPGYLDEYFVMDYLDERESIARVRVDEEAEVILVCPGGQFEVCLEAATEMLLEHDVECEIRVPLGLYPVPDALWNDISPGCRMIVTVEESTPGGTWGSELAAHYAARHSGRSPLPFHQICSADAPVPSAHHLEDLVLPTPTAIETRLASLLR